MLVALCSTGDTMDCSLQLWVCTGDGKGVARMGCCLSDCFSCDVGGQIQLVCVVRKVASSAACMAHSLSSSARLWQCTVVDIGCGSMYQ